MGLDEYWAVATKVRVDLYKERDQAVLMYASLGPDAVSIKKVKLQTLQDDTAIIEIAYKKAEQEYERLYGRWRTIRIGRN